jgi:hypothetical protein
MPFWLLNKQGSKLVIVCSRNVQKTCARVHNCVFCCERVNWVVSVGSTSQIKCPISLNTDLFDGLVGLQCATIGWGVYIAELNLWLKLLSGQMKTNNTLGKLALVYKRLDIGWSVLSVGRPQTQNSILTQTSLSCLNKKVEVWHARWTAWIVAQTNIVSTHKSVQSSRAVFQLSCIVARRIRRCRRSALIVVFNTATSAIASSYCQISASGIVNKVTAVGPLQWRSEKGWSRVN